MSTTMLLNVGLIARSKELITSTTRALADIAQCTPLAKLPNANDLQLLDAIIFFLAPPSPEEVRLLARIRATDPFKPIILVTDGIGAQHQIEFIKLGVNDVTPLASDQKLLGRKLLRAVHKSSELVMQSPILQPLTEPAEPLPNFDNRRASYRVPLPPSRQVFAVLLMHPLPLRMKVLDVAVATEDRPAGFLLKESSDAPLPPDLNIKPNQSAPVIFELKEGIASGQANIIVRNQKTATQSLSVAITCQFSAPRDESLIQNLWLEAQQASNTPPPEHKTHHRSHTHSTQEPKNVGLSQLVRAKL